MNTMQTRTHDEESALRGVRRNAIDRDICQLTRFILTEQILAGFRRCECDAAASYSGSRFIIITAASSSGASCTTSVEYGYGSDNAVTDSVSKCRGCLRTVCEWQSDRSVTGAVDWVCGNKICHLFHKDCMQCSDFIFFANLMMMMLIMMTMMMCFITTVVKPLQPTKDNQIKQQAVTRNSTTQ